MSFFCRRRNVFFFRRRRLASFFSPSPLLSRTNARTNTCKHKQALPPRPLALRNQYLPRRGCDSKDDSDSSRGKEQRRRQRRRKRRRRRPARRRRDRRAAPPLAARRQPLGLLRRVDVGRDGAGGPGGQLHRGPRRLPLLLLLSFVVFSFLFFFLFLFSLERDAARVSVGGGDCPLRAR